MCGEELSELPLSSCYHNGILSGERQVHHYDNDFAVTLLFTTANE